MRLSTLLLSLLFVAQNLPSSCQSDAVKVPAAEPAWGRIYLRRGLAPIQYFRDAYGGPMVPNEVRFYFPQSIEHRYGCELLPAAEQDLLRASNGTMALVLDRGVCSFENKSRNAEAMGAAALVVVSQDESATPPIALAAKGEIEIASVMIRKSAGELLRHLAQTPQPVRGRLIPIVCGQKPTVCTPRTANESEYVEHQPARSGSVVELSSNSSLGDFLSATFGGVLPAGPLTLSAGLAPIEGCTVDHHSPELEGKVVLFAPNADCSSLERVSSAQRAGAAAVLLAVSEVPLAMQHPHVPLNWLAYNITVASAAVSSATMLKLAALAADAVSVPQIHLWVSNSIADAWDEVRRLSVRTAWPSRKDRVDKLAHRVLTEYALDDEQLSELKVYYVDVAGGSKASWHHLLSGSKRNEARAPTEELSVAPEGV